MKATPTKTVKIDRKLYERAAAEAQRRLRTVRVHFEEILRQHFIRMERGKG